jgi:hypothetical protein
VEAQLPVGVRLVGGVVLITHTDVFRDVEDGLYGGAHYRLKKSSEFAEFRHFVYPGLFVF